MNLADLYSYLESLRRGTKGLLANPTDTLNQWGSQIKEDLGKYDQGNKVALGLLGNSDPILNTSPGEAAWQNNAGIGTNLGLLGLHIAYHGTPHTVDKFDMSKIGTGEGAQAYGHGLYFAENPKTAQAYREILARPELRDASGKPITPTPGTPESQALAYIEMHAAIGAPDPIAAARSEILKDLREGTTYDSTNGGLLGAINKFGDMGAKVAKPGAVYQVDINADPAHYLDWDKPLSQQSQKVRDFFKPLLTPDAIKNDVPGSALYQYGMDSGSPQQATALLRQAGIPGIKYKDAGSRAADGGTHNYVVFDDKLINNLGPQP